MLQRAYAIMHRYGIDLRKLERVDQTCGGIDIVDEEYPVYDYYDDQPSQTIDNHYEVSIESISKSIHSFDKILSKVTCLLDIMNICYCFKR